ncbi:MAG: hypothetical protein ABIC19_04380 [Patescibacteria group bacterium]|nr:hypothetical protein [Patescibacteria group bacterium]
MPVEHLGQYDSGVSARKIIFWFVVIGIIISLGAFYFVLSRANITLIPKTQTKELEISVTLDPNASNIDYENNTIRGVLLSEESQTNQTIKDMPPKRLEENATGKITITNGYTRAQGFKQGDVLIFSNGSGPEQKIALKENTIVYRGKTRTVEAAAIEKGVAGHIPPGKFKFEKYDDFMNEKVTATSAETFSGGIRTATLVTEDDIQLIKNNLINQISKNNIEKLKNRLRDGEELGPRSTLDTVISFHSSVAAPFETDHFEASMTLKTTAAVFKNKELESLVNQKLEKLTEDNQEFLGYDPQSLSFTVEKISSQNQQATIAVKIKGRFRPKLSTKIFNKDEIKGYNERALKAHYAQFTDIESIEIKFWPPFRKTVPDMDSRINIEIKN